MASTTLHVHVGQCGNQLGERFWSLAAAEAAAAAATANDDGDASSLHPSSHHPMFHDHESGGRRTSLAAAVFVDSEAKVVDRLRHNPALASVLRPDACVTDSSGRANNWAMGFCASLQELGQGHGLFHATVDTVRRELERVDKLQSVVLHHSLAGGTGSGVGSALLQYLREACPALTLATCSVGPFSTGDCATQWYNTAFAMHALAEHADVVLYRGNDHLLGHHLLNAAQANLPSARGQAAAKASMGILNDSLAADMACVLFPTVAASSFPFPTYQPWDARGLARSCCPFTHAKFLDVRSSWSMNGGQPAHSAGRHQPASCKAAAHQGRRQLGGMSDDWVSLGRGVAGAFPTQDLAGAPNATLAAQVTVRGVGEQDVPSGVTTSWENAAQQLAAVRRGRREAAPATAAAAARDARARNPFLPLAVGPPNDPKLAKLLHHELPHSLRLVPWRQQQHTQVIETVYGLPSSSSSEQPRAVAICANRTQMGACVGKVLGRAEEMARHGAYLHWYTRHGIEKEDFAATFEGLRRVRDEYGDLAAPSDKPLLAKAGLRAVRDYRLL